MISLIDTLEDYKNYNNLSTGELAKEMGLAYTTVYQWLHLKVLPNPKSKGLIRSFLVNKNMQKMEKLAQESFGLPLIKSVDDIMPNTYKNTHKKEFATEHYGNIYLIFTYIFSALLGACISLMLIIIFAR